MGCWPPPSQALLPRVQAAGQKAAPGCDEALPPPPIYLFPGGAPVEKLEDFVSNINSVLESLYIEIKKGVTEDDGRPIYALVSPRQSLLVAFVRNRDWDEGSESRDTPSGQAALTQPTSHAATAPDPQSAALFPAWVWRSEAAPKPWPSPPHVAPTQAWQLALGFALMTVLYKCAILGSKG